MDAVENDWTSVPGVVGHGCSSQQLRGFEINWLWEEAEELEEAEAESELASLVLAGFL